MNITKFQLMEAFLNRKAITIKGFNFAVINSVEHEDGSCQSFNVTGHGRFPLQPESVKDCKKTLHVRTID